MSSPVPEKHSNLSTISTLASFATVIIALFVIAAWWSGRIDLAGITRDYVPMSLSVALSVLLLGGAISLKAGLSPHSRIGGFSTVMAVAVLLISSDLEEVRELSDRIAVIFRGRFVGILERHEASEELLGLMMLGAARDR